MARQQPGPAMSRTAAAFRAPARPSPFQWTNEMKRYKKTYEPQEPFAALRRRRPARHFCAERKTTPRHSRDVERVRAGFWSPNSPATSKPPRLRSARISMSWRLTGRSTALTAARFPLATAPPKIPRSARRESSTAGKNSASRTARLRCEGRPSHHSRLRHHYYGDRARPAQLSESDRHYKRPQHRRRTGWNCREVILTGGTLRKNLFSLVGPISGLDKISPPHCVPSSRSRNNRNPPTSLHQQQLPRPVDGDWDAV